MAASSSMASGDEAVVEQGTVLGKVFFVGILPPVSVKGSEDEAVEYTCWLG